MFSGAASAGAQARPAAFADTFGTLSSGLGTTARGPETRDTSSQSSRCPPTPVAVQGLPRPAPPSLRDPAGQAPPVDFVRVLASRLELRVVFPCETAGAWGWTEREVEEYTAEYVWGMSVWAAMDGPGTLELRVEGRRDGPLSFDTLEELMAYGRALLCKPVGNLADCTSRGVEARVDGERVVLVLRDSAAISRLLGLRPGFARVWRGGPDPELRLPYDSVRIEYVDPAIPEPDSAFRAEAARARRRYEASVNSITRFIAADRDPAPEIWLAVGDTVALWIEEIHCQDDLCTSQWQGIADSAWTVADATVARLLPVGRDTMLYRQRLLRPSRFLAALRPGRTRVRVTGVHSASDTLPGGESLSSELTRGVVVTLPVARLEITLRPDAVVAGRPVEIRAEAFDRRGRRIEGAPVELTLWRADRPLSFHRGPEPFRLEFGTPGEYSVRVRFGGVQETRAIRVTAGPGE